MTKIKIVSGLLNSNRQKNNVVLSHCGINLLFSYNIFIIYIFSFNPLHQLHSSLTIKALVCNVITRNLWCSSLIMISLQHLNSAPVTSHGLLQLIMQFILKRMIFSCFISSLLIMEMSLYHYVFSSHIALSCLFLVFISSHIFISHSQFTTI